MTKGIARFNMESDYMVFLSLAKIFPFHSKIELGRTLVSDIEYYKGIICSFRDALRAEDGLR